MTWQQKVIKNLLAQVFAETTDAKYSDTAWVTSDTHAYHNLLINNGDRPGNFTREYIERHNALVGARDLVIHLGDISFGNSWQTERFIKALKGQKILIRGNHDRHADSWYEHAGFLAVYKSLEVDGYLFTHRPLETIPEGIRLNIHGHIHSVMRLEQCPWAQTARHRLVSIDDTLAPIRLHRLLGKG